MIPSSIQICITLFVCRFDKVYDSLYNICVAEDSIRPEKYAVNGYPPMKGFPAYHPNMGLLNTETAAVKDEL